MMAVAVIGVFVWTQRDTGDDVDAMVRNGLLQDYESWSWSFIDTARWLDTLRSG